jgi:hypothetical protein
MVRLTLWRLSLVKPSSLGYFYMLTFLELLWCLAPSPWNELSNFRRVFRTVFPHLRIRPTLPIQDVLSNISSVDCIRL